MPIEVVKEFSTIATIATIASVGNAARQSLFDRGLLVLFN
jgi:hypothetical protein